MTIDQEIQLLPQAQFLFFATLSIVGTLAGLYWARKFLSTARLVENIPTAKIRSAHQGYVELEGYAEAMAGEPIISPLSQTPCCWFRYRVERRSKDKWETVKSGVSDALFLIKDSTGTCVIDPDNAQVTVIKEESWSGDGAVPMIAGQDILHFGTADFMSSYRYSESVLLTGQPLYAMGHFKTLNDLDHNKNRKEMVGEILREWKRDPVSLKQRFDKNNDGVVDAQEWQVALDKAQIEAATQYIEQMQHQHLNLLSCSFDKRQPFILSFVPQGKLIKSYRWKSRGAIVLFFIAGSIATILLSSRSLL